MCTNSCGTTTNSSSSLSSSPSAPSPLMDIDDIPFLKQPDTIEPMATDNDEKNQVHNAMFNTNKKEFNVFRNSDAKYNINSLDETEKTTNKYDTVNLFKVSSKTELTVQAISVPVDSENAITTTDSSNETINLSQSNETTILELNGPVTDENSSLTSSNKCDSSRFDIKKDIISDKICNENIINIVTDTNVEHCLKSECKKDMNLCAEINDTFIGNDVVTNSSVDSSIITTTATTNLTSFN